MSNHHMVDPTVSVLGLLGALSNLDPLNHPKPYSGRKQQDSKPLNPA